MSKVTCLMVSHNKSGFVDESIQSVLNQTYQNWELIITDSGILLDQNYFVNYKDDRIKFIRSLETNELRKKVAIAPWCFNEMIPLVKGDYVCYLCDDDIYYENAFEVIVKSFERNSEWMAIYCSQHRANYDRPNKPVITFESHARELKGMGFGRLDCVIDYMQMAHRKEVFNYFPGREFWVEDIAHKHHSDGLTMEKIGRKFIFHPVPIFTTMNRRTKISDNIPMR